MVKPYIPSLACTRFRPRIWFPVIMSIPHPPTLPASATVPNCSDRSPKCLLGPAAVQECHLNRVCLFCNRFCPLLFIQNKRSHVGHLGGGDGEGVVACICRLQKMIEGNMIRLIKTSIHVGSQTKSFFLGNGRALLHQQQIIVEWWSRMSHYESELYLKQSILWEFLADLPIYLGEGYFSLFKLCQRKACPRSLSGSLDADL